MICHNNVLCGCCHTSAKNRFIPEASPPVLPVAAQVVPDTKGYELCFSTVVACTISLIRIRFVKPFQACTSLGRRVSVLCICFALSSPAMLQMISNVFSVASSKSLTLACCLGYVRLTTGLLSGTCQPLINLGTTTTKATATYKVYLI